jgi:hypothetical protein
MNDYDPVVMGVLEPILVLSVMAVSAFLTRILSSPNFEHVHAASVLFARRGGGASSWKIATRMAIVTALISAMNQNLPQAQDQRPEPYPPEGEGCKAERALNLQG